LNWKGHRAGCGFSGKGWGRRIWRLWVEWYWNQESGEAVIQITPQMRILVAIEAVDGRKGIDSLAQLCQEKLEADPFSGCLFVFRTRRGTSIRILVYDGQGFWLAQKRLSVGRFRFWPASATEVSQGLAAHQLQVLLMGGDPTSAKVPPNWRRVSVPA